MAARARAYWLLKSEPSTYSIDDLARDGGTPWTGVRNYQARNYLRDQMKAGDGVLFYHSSSDPTGVAGLAEVASAPYPDATDAERPEPPIWFVVDVAFVEKLAEVLPLAALKAAPALASMMVTKKGSRLSVQPVSADEWKTVLGMAKRSKKKTGKKG